MAVQTRSQAGSEQKEGMISETIEKERGKLLSFISRRTPTLEDAEDILQDVFYELVQSEAIENTAAWLYRVARNKITDWYRKMKPSRLDDITLSAEGEDEALMLSDILPSMETPAERQLLLKLIAEMLAEALSELPPGQREVFVLHEIERKSMKEIAELQGTGIKTVISRKRYAVLHLQDRMRGLYEELIND